MDAVHLQVSAARWLPAFPGARVPGPPRVRLRGSRRVPWLYLALMLAPVHAAPQQATYRDHVRPIFRQHCLTCHDQDEKKGDLALDSYSSALAGGASGRVLIAGDPVGSRLWKLVSRAEAPHMPPDQDPLPEEQLETIRVWIAQGLPENTADGPPKGPRVAYIPTNANRPADEPAMPRGLPRKPFSTTPRPNAVDALGLSPWAPLTAVGGLRQVVLYRTDTAALLGIVPYHEGKPHALRFSRDGSLLLVGGGRAGAVGNAVLYNVRSGDRLTTLGEETDAVLAADISPDHRLVALGGPKKTVRVYRTTDGSLAYEIKRHADWIMALEFSPDGKLLATADRSGQICLWESRRGNPRVALPIRRQAVTAVAWRSDSQQLATSCEDGAVSLWQANGASDISWVAHPGGTLDVAYAHDGRIASCGRDAQAKIWQLDGQLIRSIAQLSDVGLSIGWTHDDRRVVVGDWKGLVQVVDVATEKQVGVLRPNPR